MSGRPRASERPPKGPAPLRLGTNAEGVHLIAEVDAESGELVRLRGTNGAELIVTKRGGATLAAWLYRWARPHRRLKLWGFAEICEHEAVSAATVQKWRKHPTFPKPAAELRAGPVWEADLVKAWARDERRRPGRPRKA